MFSNFTKSFLKNNLNKYKLGIFDLDGTLINSMPYHIEAWLEACERLSIRVNKNFFEDKGGMSSFDVAFLLTNNVKKANYLSSLKSLYYQEKIKEIKCYDEPLHLLKFFYRMNIQCAIGTGSKKKNVLSILNLLEIKKYFKFIVTCEDCYKHKPDPECFIKISQLSGITSDKIIIFEDAVSGISAAKYAKMDCCVYKNGIMERFYPSTK